MTEIRVKRGWSYGAYSDFKYGLKPRSWQVHLFPASKDTAAALKTTLQMITDWHDKGLTQEEFAFSQKSLLNSAGFIYSTPRKRLENKILEKTLDLPDGFFQSYAKRLPGVTLAATQAAVKKFSRPDRLSIGVLATAQPMKAALAEAAGVAADQVKVLPYNQ